MLFPYSLKTLNAYLIAIELCNKCLVVLNNVTHSKEDLFTKYLYFKIFKIMFLVYFDMNDNTKSERCAEIAVALSHDTGNAMIEAFFSLQLAKMCKDQRRLEESEKHCGRAIRIAKIVGEREIESEAYSCLGCVSECKENIKRQKGISRKHLPSTWKL